MMMMMQTHSAIKEPQFQVWEAPMPPRRQPPPKNKSLKSDSRRICKCDLHIKNMQAWNLPNVLPGLHKLWYPSVRDTSTWSKFGVHGEHGDVFLFSNLGAL